MIDPVANSNGLYTVGTVIYGSFLPNSIMTLYDSTVYPYGTEQVNLQNIPISLTILEIIGATSENVSINYLVNFSVPFSGGIAHFQARIWFSYQSLIQDIALSYAPKSQNFMTRLTKSFLPFLY